jgi:hypothetical protein
LLQHIRAYTSKYKISNALQLKPNIVCWNLIQGLFTLKMMSGFLLLSSQFIYL